MRWHVWLRRRDARVAHDAELTEELQAHLEMAVAQRIERGESPAEAQANARREFGNVTHVAEVTREMWGGASWDAFARDLRYAARGLRRSPAFTAVAVATFALGIGANTAMFTVVNGALLAPLPYPHQDQLVYLTHRAVNAGPNRMHLLSDHTFVELRAARPRAFASLATLTGSQMTLTGDSSTPDAEPINAGHLTANFTTTLGVSPTIGRTFTAEEETGAAHVVLLSDQLWRERYAGATSVLGRSITLNGISYVVIGVMPPAFDMPHGVAVWTPLTVRPQPNNYQDMSVIARLSPGTTIAAARRELEATLARLPSTADDKPGTEITEVLPLVDMIVKQARPSLLMFGGAVFLVLLIACANVANLLLIRAATRRHEIGVRAALGAGRARIVRQFMTESALVACIGGAVGIVLAKWGVRVLIATAPPGRIPRGQTITVDWRVLGVSFGVSLVAGLVCGIFPALASTRRDPRDALAATGRTVAGSNDRLRRVFVVAQLSLAIVLLTGAGLLLKSFERLRGVDTGFQSGGIVTFRVILSPKVFPTPTDMHVFEGHLLDRVRRVPGVETASMVDWLPLRPPLMIGGLHIDGISAIPERYPVDKIVVAPGYFTTMGIRLFAGRDFDSRDNASSQPVTIVSRSIAQQFWPPDGRGAIGQRLTESDSNPRPGDWQTIVGVVDDVVQQGLTHGRDHAQYVPLAQSGDLPFPSNDVTFAVRTARSVADLTPSLRAIAHEVNSGVALRDIRSMDDVAAASIANSRFETQLVTLFAALALLLAAVGTYGVLAYDVAARAHELGVRVALGAMSSDVIQVVERRTLALVMPGLALGLIGAVAVTRVLQKSLFDVTPTDPTTLLAVSGVLLLVALIAGIGPARRAMRADPMTALRSE